MPPNIWSYIDVYHPLSRYIFILAVIFLALVALRYISRMLQWSAEEFFFKKDFKGKIWLHLMARHKVFSNIFFTFAMVVLSAVSSIVLGDSYPKVTSLVIRVLDCTVVISVMLVLNSFLNVVKEKYSSEIKFPIKGIIQALKIVFWVITVIFSASVLINKEPIYLFGGLTALSAVLLLVFKDSILGLTSGFQLLMSDLVRVGDWIEVPGQRVDGEVMDVLITTVRVRNWDNTIVNIPTYYLIANAFVNWRGMSDSGGRRIKRSFNIDVSAVRFLGAEDIEKLRGITLLKNYFSEKEDFSGSSRKTNLGAFRAYCYEYLKENPKISKKFTCMVRQLDPTTEGIPLEIYAFFDGTDWEQYENLQSDIFEHLLAMAKEFDIKIYQRFFE